MCTSFQDTKWESWQSSSSTLVKETPEEKYNTKKRALTDKVDLRDTANDESDGVRVWKLVLVQIAGINGVYEAAGVLIALYIRRLAPGHRLWGSKTIASANFISSGLTEIYCSQ